MHLRLQDVSTFADRARTRPVRLEPSEVMLLREQRLTDLKMWEMIREVLAYCCVLVLINLFASSRLDSNSSTQVNHLRRLFLNTRQNQHDYTQVISALSTNEKHYQHTQVSTVHDYWNWLESSFVDNLRAQQWYNGQAPRNLSGYLNDKSTRLIGWATMRQLRIKTSLCQRRSICRRDYSASDEERTNFAPGWQASNASLSQYSPSICKSFRYVDADQLDSYVNAGDHQTYQGGGYVYELRGRLSDLRTNLSQLRELQWIDARTRAVIIQFPLYNPNVQLFTSATLLVEFLSNGGLYPQSRFEPLSFQSRLLSSCFRFSPFSLASLHIDIPIGLHYSVPDLDHLSAHPADPVTPSTQTELFPSILVVHRSQHRRVLVLGERHLLCAVQRSQANW